MFGFHIAFALNLLSFGMGIALIVWSTQLVGHGKNIAAWFGYFIAILAALVLICTTYYGFKGWYFFHKYERPMILRMQQNMRQSLQQNNQAIPAFPRQGGMMQPPVPSDPNSRANHRPFTQVPPQMGPNKNNNSQSPNTMAPAQPPQSSNRLHHPGMPKLKQASISNFNLA